MVNTTMISISLGKNKNLTKVEISPPFWLFCYVTIWTPVKKPKCEDISGNMPSTIYKNTYFH